MPKQYHSRLHQSPSYEQWVGRSGPWSVAPYQGPLQSVLPGKGMEVALRKSHHKGELSRLVNRLRQIRRYKDKRNSGGWGREPNTAEMEWEEWEWEEDERRKRLREGKPPLPRDVAKEEARMERMRGKSSAVQCEEEAVMDDWLSKLIDELYEEQQRMVTSNPSDPDCDECEAVHTD